MVQAPDEYFGTSPKKGRGRAQKTLDLIEEMHKIAEAAQPITGRGVGYKLFVVKLIASMKKNEMQRVYRLLKEAREEGVIPWPWIVDETRDLEKVSTWSDPADFVRTVKESYRRESSDQQPVLVEVWSEKGTVRGVLAPVLNKYGIGFRPVHGFSGATTVHDVAESDDGRPLKVFYVGDYDPSGMCMSEHDLPNRLKKYGGDHVSLKRIALTRDDCNVMGEIRSFPASDKKKDPRYKWFVERYGNTRDGPEHPTHQSRRGNQSEIEPIAWNRCEVVNMAECESLRTVLDKWNGLKFPR